MGPKLSRDETGKKKLGLAKSPHHAWRVKSYTGDVLEILGSVPSSSIVVLVVWVDTDFSAVDVMLCWVVMGLHLSKGWE